MTEPGLLFMSEELVQSMGDTARRALAGEVPLPASDPAPAPPPAVGMRVQRLQRRHDGSVEIELLCSRLTCAEAAARMLSSSAPLDLTFEDGGVLVTLRAEILRLAADVCEEPTLIIEAMPR